MVRRNISIDKKIERQKEAISLAKDKYELALKELGNLMKKKREIQWKKLLDAFANSNKSLDDILAFIVDKDDEESQKIDSRVNFFGKLRLYVLIILTI